MELPLNGSDMLTCKTTFHYPKVAFRERTDVFLNLHVAHSRAEKEIGKFIDQRVLSVFISMLNANVLGI